MFTIKTVCKCYLMVFIVGKEYSRFVYESFDGESLFTLDHIQSMCKIEDDNIRNQDAFRSACTRVNQHITECCPSWSLGNYVTLLSNRTTCRQLTKSDVDYVLDLLSSCLPFYKNLSLLPNCDQTHDPEYSQMSETPHFRNSMCQFVPDKCKYQNAIYHIFHYITDIDFVSSNSNTQKPFLRYAMSFIPVATGLGSMDLYKSITIGSLQDANVKVVAIHFDIKQLLFDHFLLMDSIWIGAAIALIFLCMWLYTTSIFTTTMSVFAIFMALDISYFIYTIVFEIKFFPFMNLLTVVILIGIGADDVFIYCRMWKLSKSERNHGTLQKLISDTLKHASLSMFVTSLTTAAAFYVSYVSSITALRCFAIYAGTAVLVNFILMITWIPATIVIHDKWCSVCFSCYQSDIHIRYQRIGYYCCRLPRKIYEAFVDWARIFFEKFLPYAVVKLRYLWLLIFLTLSVCGLLAIVYYPKLRLPSANAFKVFSPEHPFEVYDFVMKEQFWFEKAAGSSVATMPLVIIWGVYPVDNGNYLDPHQTGSLELDTSFNMATPAAQKWLMEFCASLRSTKYYHPYPGLQLTNCFIENFKKYMERPCDRDETKCCGLTKFPFPKKDFEECLRLYVPLLQKTMLKLYMNKDAGPRYLKTSTDVAALIVEFDSNKSYSLNYQEMKDFFTYMDNWVKEQLKKAPKEMSAGWFVSELDFYDTQNSIAHGTLISMAVSLAIASFVAFFTTLNVLVSVYALLTIASVVFVTVGCLVMLGWELNILESVTISVAVGLSIDFTLHYGVAYRLSPDLDKELRVVFSLTKMASPISMAAVTTFLAGAAMMPSTILAYRQLGVFLMLIMTISWLFSTFFFLALLRLAGPQGSFGQFHWPTCDCCCFLEKEHVDKTIYTMSESTLSTSSNHAANSETHELEPLADNKDHYHHHHNHHHHHHHHKKYRHNHRRPTSSSQDHLENANYLSQPTSKHRTPSPLTRDTPTNGGSHINKEPQLQAEFIPLRQGDNSSNTQVI